MLGEIRDGATASLAIQAALSGHRLICTLHAADPAAAIARLLEMGLEPYHLTSSLFGILAQRLLRRRSADGQYHGRIPAAELAMLDEPMRQAILRRADAQILRQGCHSQQGYVTMRAVADALADRGVTDAAEVQRIFGEDR